MHSAYNHKWEQRSELLYPLSSHRLLASATKTANLWQWRHLLNPRGGGEGRRLTPEQKDTEANSLCRCTIIRRSAKAFCRCNKSFAGTSEHPPKSLTSWHDAPFSTSKIMNESWFLNEVLWWHWRPTKILWRPAESMLPGWACQSVWLVEAGCW